MQLDLLLPLAGFSLVSSITPGPNNIMLMTSGVNYGFRQTLPHMIGVALGFWFLLFCVGMGLGQLLTQAPLLFQALKIAGAAYLIYLAWRIARSGPVSERSEQRGRPMRFYEAVAFQWVNPKAWMMAIIAMTTYTLTDHYLASMALVIVVFALLNLPCITMWTGFGTLMRGFLSEPARLRTFNMVMAGLLIVSLWPMLA
jgi:threonine/homoserine/homoserine lactone efflux protein